MSPKHMFMDYGLLWINALAGACMPVQLCVHAHVQHALPACLRARWRSRLWAGGRTRGCMLPSRPSSAPRCLHSLNLCSSQLRAIRPQPQESSRHQNGSPPPHQSQYLHVFWLHGETRTHGSLTCVHAARYAKQMNGSKRTVCVCWHFFCHNKSCNNSNFPHLWNVSSMALTGPRREDVKSSQSLIPSCPHPAMQKPHPAPRRVRPVHVPGCVELSPPPLPSPRRMKAVGEDSAPRGADSPRFSDWSVRGWQLRGGEGGQIVARCAAA